MTRHPGADASQADLFGGAPKPKAPKARAARAPRPDPAGPAPGAPDTTATPVAPAPLDGPATAEEGVTAIAARLSPADLDELAAALPDEALACLVLAAARQLRRRLARAGGRAGRRPSPALERAARQLLAELGGDGSPDDT